jgi:hypothetical protein
VHRTQFVAVLDVLAHNCTHTHACTHTRVHTPTHNSTVV